MRRAFLLFFALLSSTCFAHADTLYYTFTGTETSG